MKKIDIDVFNLAIPSIPIEKTAADFVSGNFQPFGDDNLFPQKLAEINRSSTAHRAILKYKQIFIIGEGFEFDETNNDLTNFVNIVNNKETLRQFYKKIITDWLGFGNNYVEIVTDAARSFLNLFHRDATTARINKEGTGIILHPDWTRYGANRKLSVNIPLYPKFDKVEKDKTGNLHSILHIKNYEPEFNFYGLPDWIAARDVAGIIHKTNKWNLSRLDNSFQPSGIMELVGDADNEEMKKGKKKIEQSFTGEGKNSKLIVIVKEAGGDSVKYTPLVQTQTGDWIELHKLSIDELIMAHSWFRSLSGIGEAGQLGNTQQIRNEYEIAKATTIADARESTLEPIKKVINNEMNIDTESLNIINLAPTNILDKLDLNLFITKGEGRQIAGYPVDETDQTMKEFIKKEGNSFKVTSE